MKLELWDRSWSVLVEDEGTLVSARMAEIVRMLTESLEEDAIEEGVETPILTLEHITEYVVGIEHSYDDKGTTEMINLGIDLLHMKGIYFSRELVEEDKYGYIGGYAQMRQDSIVSQPVIKDTSFRGF